MNIDVTLKNYRCFSDEHPATFRLRPGLTAFVGRNNAGKSSVLRFLYEFRNLFQSLSGNAALLSQALNGQGPGLNLAQSITDPHEVFHNGNQRDFTIQIAVDSEAQGPSPVQECKLFDI